LPGRGPTSGPPQLPRRNNTLSPPALPSRGGSASPESVSLSPPVPPPPPSRSPLPPANRISPSTPSDQGSPPPPAFNLSTKPGASPALSFTAPTPAFSAPTPPRRSPAISHVQPTIEDDIDWANLSKEDKEVLFSWFDEFFTRLLGVPVGHGQGTSHGSLSAGPPPALRLSVSNIFLHRFNLKIT
jgi:Wiskott-Aldrich syndrome protein